MISGNRKDTILGLEFINALHPVDYKWNYREDYQERIIEEIEEDVEHIIKDEKGNDKIIIKKEKVARQRIIQHENDGSKTRKRYHHGLIAQEVKEAADKMGIDFAGYQDAAYSGGLERQTLSYSHFIAPLIKAVQELSARVVVLESKKK